MTSNAAGTGPLRLLVLGDGSSIHTERWLRGLADSGPVELRLVTMNPAGVREGIRQISAVRAVDEFYAGSIDPAGQNWRYVLNLPRLLRTVRRWRPQAIVSIYLSSYGLLAAVVKGRARLAHVLLGSDVMVAPGRSSLYRWFTRRALRRGDLFVSPSRAISGRLEALGVDPDDVITQQYGLEDWILDHPEVPKTYDLVSNRAWLPNSNIPKVLRIFGRLSRARSLALVGGGTEADATIVGQAATDPRVETLGVLEHRQNVDVVARSRFYLSMTESDGASLSLMEAMALGAIPVVSDIEPNREWVEESRNGALLPLDDEASAAARIEALMAKTETQLEAMRQQNRAIVRERGSLTRNTARFRSRLDEVLARRTGTSR